MRTWGGVGCYVEQGRAEMEAEAVGGLNFSLDFKPAGWLVVEGTLRYRLYLSMIDITLGMQGCCM